MQTAVELKGALADGYSREYYAARDNVMFQAEVKHLLMLAAPSPEDRMLEPGCGGGLFLAACRRERTPALLMGVDVNAGAASLAARVAPAVLADAARLPVVAGAFDVIVAQHLIEHFGRPEEALREWHRALAPGGRVVVATPNAAYPDPALFDDPTHRHIYLPSEIRRLFEENGFRVERCYTLMPFLGSRRLTWTLAKWFVGPLLALRFLPYFRTRGLTLFLSAGKVERAAECEHGHE
jgi:SAM-dependent methyltransferase